ncbi:hypothetical protein ElyMa_000716800 [Elysia marginata]|uniref:Uncharacterized protein n=1 Tax=Elysia marginata TaxID=1093978 RepID=A0AAV4GLW9_9GAST|nr:hypothetical protein ElyMa_000716800 [Elysia marginata]
MESSRQGQHTWANVWSRRACSDAKQKVFRGAVTGIPATLNPVSIAGATALQGQSDDERQGERRLPGELVLPDANQLQYSLDPSYDINNSKL